MFFIALLLTLLEALYTATTVPVIGCLSYKNGVCIYCDQMNWYFIIGATCQYMPIDNCIYSYNGQICSACHSGYYADTDTGACILVPSEISHCALYSDATTCLTCNTGYYLNGTSCAKSDVTIPGCGVYFDRLTCFACSSGFLKTPGILVQSGSSFVTSNNFCQNFTDPNCQSGAILSCVSCKPGYMAYKNNYLNIIKGLSNVMLKKMNMNNVPSIGTSTFSVCAQQALPNCLVYSQFYACSKCKDGYFVDPNGICQLVPDSIILNCFEYLTTGVCRQCLAGFYLSAPDTCTPHTTTIANCQTMSQTQLNTCVQCTARYFLSSNMCVARSVQIANCATYSITGEICIACSPTFLLSPDSSQCFNSLFNCHTYVFSQNQISCKYCNAGMYFDATQGCIKVPTSVTGCMYYASRQTANALGNMYECAICNNNYYLKTSDNTCVSFDPFIGTQILCQSTDPLLKNICNGCYPRQVLYNVKNYCEVVPSVSLDQNCQTYNSTGWCIQCANGYFLTNGRCYQISILNCQQVSLDNALLCVKCISTGLYGYFVQSTNIPNNCILSYNHITMNCVNSDDVDTSPTTNQNTNVCKACYAPNYPENFLYAMFCVPLPTLINNYGVLGSLPSSANCRIWDVPTQSCFCCKFNLTGNYQWVLSNNLCVQSCPAGQNIKTISLPYTFYCNTINPVLLNCYREDGQNCAACALGYLPYVQQSVAITSYSVFSYIPINQTNHFKSKANSFNSTWNRIFTFPSCYTLTINYGMIHTPTYTNQGNPYPITILAVDYNPATSSIYSKCRGVTTYVTNSDTVWGCISCVFGFIGYYVWDNTQSKQFVPNCALNQNCNYGTFYNGLGLQNNHGMLDFWVSCHLCATAGLIPSFSKWSRFGSVGAGVLPSSATNFYGQTDCVAIGLFPTNTNFPANCGVQEVLPNVVTVGYPLSGALTGVNPICWACKPGYKATFDATTNYVATCVKIANCDLMMGGDTFNKCTYCLTGYALNQAMDTCVQTTIAHCYQLDTSTQVYKCTKCIFGYVVSRDQMNCNTINILNCLLNELFYLDPNNPTGPYLGAGCLRCELGYVAVSMELPQAVCVYNPVFTNLTSPSTIPNCYIYSSLTQCSQCNVGYTLPQGVYNQCIPLAQVAHCSVYATATTCQSCSAGYFLQGNTCVDGSLYISNCLVFTSPTVCATCAAGYVPIAYSPTNVRCFYAASTLWGCTVFDNALSLSSKTIACVNCTTGYYPNTPTPTIANLSGCLTIPSISNCQTYNTTPTSSSCIQCSDAYYLVKPSVLQPNLLEQCVLRANYPDPACAVTNLTADSCQVCQSGYYVRNGVCMTKPTGVVNCAVYQDLSTCLKCGNNTYLAANLCLAIPNSNLVTNCLYYKDSATCSDCKPSYFLSNNQCLLISVSNCDIYQSSTVCLQCSSGYFLSSIGNCQKPLIPNCLIFGSLNGCQLCASGYYVDQNQKCSQVPTAKRIPGCLYYAQNLTCSQCTGGTILSPNATNCSTFSAFRDLDLETSQFDPNCDAYVYQDTCVACKGTYLFSNGVCVPCNVNLPNCFFCDFNNKTNCIACVPGYSMSDAGQCVSNQDTENSYGSSTAVSFNYTPSTGFMPTWAMGVELLRIAASFAILAEVNC